MISTNDISALKAKDERDRLLVPAAVLPNVIVHRSGLYLWNADSGYWNRFYPSGTAGGEMPTFGPPVGGSGHIGPLAATNLVFVSSAETDSIFTFDYGEPADEFETPDTIELLAFPESDAAPLMIAMKEFSDLSTNEFRVPVLRLFPGNNVIELRASNQYGFTYATNSINLPVF